MKRIVPWLLPGVVLLAVGAAWWLTHPTRAQVRLQRALAARLAGIEAAPGNRVGTALSDFYRRRGNRAAWSDGRRPGDDAGALVLVLGQAGREGLDAADYAASALAAELTRLRGARLAALMPDPDTLADFDLRLTRAFLGYASDLHDGRLPASALDPDWVASREPLDPTGALRRALGAHRVARTLERLAPRGEDYLGLRAALERYRALAAAGGWPAVPEGPPLRRGDRGARVLALARRLALEGDAVVAQPARASGTGGTRPTPGHDAVGVQPAREFDAGLARAVLAFQRQHGLRASGTVDEATRAALNVPAAGRARQIELNLERRRWLPPAFPEPCILVNLADFALEVRDSGRVALRSRVVVGQRQNPTPTFSAAVSYLMLNPPWRLPRRIVVEEILPTLERDTSYLATHQMRVLFTHAAELTEVPARTVDWSAVEEDSFPYLVVQDPGPENPLGRIKLTCPNEYDVYLHDTPAKGYFEAWARAYSHGCVRVEKARELAGWLIARDTLRARGATGAPRAARRPDVRDSLDDALASLATRRVGLRLKTPVHFLYWTAWVDSSGAVQFRDDLYGLDRRLDEAMRSGKAAGFVLNPALEWGQKHRRVPSGQEPAEPTRGATARAPGAAGRAAASGVKP